MAWAQEFMASLGNTVRKVDAEFPDQPSQCWNTAQLWAGHFSSISSQAIHRLARNINDTKDFFFFKVSENKDTASLPVDPFTGITWEDSECQVSACGRSCVRTSSQSLNSTQKPSLFSLGRSFFFLLCTETNSGEKNILSEGLPGFCSGGQKGHGGAGMRWHSLRLVWNFAWEMLDFRKVFCGTCFPNEPDFGSLW